MLNILQNLFNRISDTLGPMGSYHPAKNRRFGLAHFRFFLVVMVPLFMIVVTVVLSLVAILLVLTTSTVPHTWLTIGRFVWYVLRTYWLIVPIAAVFYLLCSASFAFFWNRRASTLPADPEPEPVVEPEAWPPAPTIGDD